MLSGTQSGCINHPAMQAVARCKQCGKPVCGSCIVAGPTGRFCSADCRDNHLKFAQRAQQFEGRARSAWFVKIRSGAAFLLVTAAVLAALGIIASFIQIPVLTDLTFLVRGWIGV